MHGAQPSPKVIPSTGAPHRPAGGRAWILRSRWNQGIPPMKTTPMRITSRPSTTVIHVCPRSQGAAPTCARSTDISTNTKEKPSTNSPVPASIRPRRRCCRSEPVSPVTYPRYPGTRGSTHGEAKEISPARAARGTAAHREPSSTT